MHVTVVHQYETRDMSQRREEAERPKGAAFGVADARETDGGNGGEGAIVEQVEKNRHIA